MKKVILAAAAAFAISGIGSVAAHASGAPERTMWFTPNPNGTKCVDLSTFSGEIRSTVRSPAAWASELRREGYIVGFRTEHGLFGAAPIIFVISENARSGKEVGYRPFFAAWGDCHVWLSSQQSDGNAPSPGEAQ